MVIEREPLIEKDINNIFELSKFISIYNLKEIVTILGKIHFQKQVNPSLTYDWLQKIVEATEDKKLISKSREIKRHFVGMTTKATDNEIKISTQYSSEYFQWY